MKQAEFKKESVKKTFREDKDKSREIQSSVVQKCDVTEMLLCVA